MCDPQLPFEVSASDELAVAFVVCLPLLCVAFFVLSPLVGWLVDRVRPAAARLAAVEVRFPPSLALAASRALAWCARALSEVRARLTPEREYRRRLGRYIASEPHGGLTLYEEYEAAISALPPGPARLALRRTLRRSLRVPSRMCVEKARARRGRLRAAEGYVAALLRGDRPRRYSAAA